MIYRIVATVLLLAMLLAAVYVSEGDSSPTPRPTSTSVSPDDSAMKSLRIE